MRRAILAVLLVTGCGSGALSRSLPLSLSAGAVASPEATATTVGASVLSSGGNAVDAAVAVAFALAVTFPNAGNLGGGGFMIVHMNGEDFAIDYRETAPAAATRDMYLDEKGTPRGDESLRTCKAAGVPGTVAGLWRAHQKWGSKPWKSLLGAAMSLCSNAGGGMEIDEATDRTLRALRARPEFAAEWGKGDGSVSQMNLHKTLGRIAELGRDGFYKGETARLIVEQMKRGNGLITADDLANYEPKERRPVVGTYRGRKVVSMPPPSSGGAILVQMLNMIEGFDIAKMGHNSAAYLHLVCEIEKRAFADRSVFFGDSDFFDVPLDGLTSKRYARERMASFDPAKRTDPATLKEGAPRGKREKEETTHFSIVDAKGNAVANTYTLNDSYGSGIFVQGAGFLLNNEMDDFSIKPGVRNMYGVIGGEANAIAPGKRMLSSMSPTIVYDTDGRLWLVLGTPGGPTIFTQVFQVIVNRIDFGMTLAQAVAAPRFHHQWPPAAKDRDPIRIESLDAPVKAALQKLGYAFDTRRIGDFHAVEVDYAANKAIGASDPRGTGTAE